MPQVTTPDGQVIFVPDQFPGLPAPPPVDFGGGIAPVAPAPVPSVVDQLPPEVLANLGIGTPPPPPVVPFEQATPPPVQNAPDFQAPSQATFGAQNVRQNRAFEQGQARQRAYEASPEGRIEGAAQGAQGQLEQQAQTAEGLGDVASREAEESRALLEDRNVNLQRERQASESQERERAQGIADRRVSYEKAIDAEANYKVDEGRRWSNAGTGRKVLAGISVALSGLGDALQFKSGPNMAIQIIQDAIKDDVAAQIREREQLGRVADRRRNSIDTYRQETGDLRDAANLKVAEEYKRTADQIEAAAAKYASPKAQAAAMNNASALRVQSQQLMGQAAEGAFNRDLQRQGVALQRAGIGVQYAKLKEEQRQFDKGMELNEKKLLLDAAQMDQSGNSAGAKALREQAQQEKTLGVGGVVQETLNQDGTKGVTYDIIRNEDGSAFTAPSDTEAKELRAQKGAVDTINQFTNDMVRGIAEHGGESAFFKSDEWQKMKAKEAFIMTNLRIVGKMGSLDEGAINATKAMLGGADPTSYVHDAKAGLLAGRDAAISQLNNNLRAASTSPSPVREYRPPDTSKTPRATVSPEDKGLQLVEATLNTIPEDILKKELGVGKSRAFSYENTRQAITDRYYDKGGILDAQKQVIDGWEKRLKSGTPQQREEARTFLGVTMTSPTASDGVKAYAASKIGSDVLTEPGLERTSGSARSAAYETAPPAPR